MDSLSHVHLLRSFKYDPETGLFTRLVASGPARAGSVTGKRRKDKTKYPIVSLGKVQFSAGRLAWFYMTGQWPTGDVDHKDGDRSNNAWENLRDVEHAVNNQNLQRAHRDSKSGLLGVVKDGNRWRAYISPKKSNTKQIHLGGFATKEEAHAAYVKAKRELHEGCLL